MTFSLVYVYILGNSRTIRQRMNQWSVFDAAGQPGQKLDSECVLHDTIRSLVWKCLLLTRDNLVVNDCVIAVEERALPGDGTTLLSLPCCGHSAVLSMKPMMLGSGLPSNLIRLAHLMQSGRQQDQFNAALEAEFKDKWRFKRVLDMPDAAGTWHADAKRVSATLSVNFKLPP
jgi:hypothetical protein